MSVCQDFSGQTNSEKNQTQHSRPAEPERGLETSQKHRPGKDQGEKSLELIDPKEARIFRSPTFTPLLPESRKARIFGFADHANRQIHSKTQRPEPGGHRQRPSQKRVGSAPEKIDQGIEANTKAPSNVHVAGIAKVLRPQPKDRHQRSIKDPGPYKDSSGVNHR